MKTFKLCRHHRQHTSKFKLFPPDGVQHLRMIVTTNQVAAMHICLNHYDQENYFPKQDGSIKDQDGNTVYKLGSPIADFGDYYYTAEEEAMKKSEKEAIREKFIKDAPIRPSVLLKIQESDPDFWNELIDLQTKRRTP